MRVFAVNDVVRAAVHIYVDLGEREDGNRYFLMPARSNGVSEEYVVAPGCEAPIYVTFPKAAAMQLAAAIESPLVDERVTLETFADFVALVDRTFGEPALDCAAPLAD